MTARKTAPKSAAQASPPNKLVVIDYTNYRGERSTRVIEPKDGGVRFGTTEYHTEPQWLLDAVDIEKDAMRTFAMRDIHSWKPA